MKSALNIRIYSHTLSVPATVVLAVALAFPDISSAVSIGEIVSQSKLGEPLTIRVALKSEPLENIESACLSLQTPDPNEEGAQDYLVTAKLAVTTEMGRQFAVISSHRPFNEAFGKIRLQVNCRGQGSVSKTLTFLPDFDAAPPAQISVPSLASGEQSPAGIALSLSQSATLNALPEPTAIQGFPMPASGAPAISLKKDFSAKSGKRQHFPATRTARKKRAHSEVFMFKLSSEPLDESRIGKISSEEREMLLSRQKLLDADDQMASFLAMQHQIKQLQDELGEIKLKLTQLNANSPLTSPPMAALPGADAGGSRHLSSILKEKKLGFFVGGLILAILALLLGLRYYNRINSQRLGKEAWGLVSAESASAKIASPMPRSATLNTGSGNFNKTQSAPPSPAAKASNVVATSSSYTKFQEELSEVDSIIEEAELYSTYGRPERAILMLQELIQKNPSKIKAWELLLFILSSQKKVAEFEKAARDFMNLNQNNATWKKIKAMRLSLEQDSPLHADGNTSPDAITDPPPFASGKRRLLGKILVETGALSALEMKNCLDDFDPKLDGRIGEYLVSRNAITHEQLSEALRLQQEDKAAKQPADHDIVRFLPDSGPKRDERLDEYMKMDMARNNKPKKP